MKTATLIREAKKRYPFLKNVWIYIEKGGGVTRFTPASELGGSDHIEIYLGSIRKNWNTPRFVRRLGRHERFGDFALVVLLHEICHVQQGYKAYIEAYREIDDLDSQSHDNHWTERAADGWARKEFKRWTKKERIQ